MMEGVKVYASHSAFILAVVFLCRGNPRQLWPTYLIVLTRSGAVDLTRQEH